MAARGPELAAQLASGADARESVYAELLAIEEEHHLLYANATGRGGGSAVSIHVGGLEGPELEDEKALASLFGRFGTVLAATLRVRREVKNGKAVVSWALVSFSSAAEAEAALAGSADLAAQHTGLVTRKVDEVQAAHSTGAMGEVMRTHVGARAAALRASQSTDVAAKDIAVACASPLCEVLCKDVSEVGVEEYRRAAQVLTAICGIDPARVGGECLKPDQCSMYKVWTAPNSALGVVLAKEPSALTAEDALTVACACAPAAVLQSSMAGLDGNIQAAGITPMEWAGMWMPACFVVATSTPEDDRNIALLPLLLQLLRAPDKLPAFALPGMLFTVGFGTSGRPAVASKLLEQGAFEVFMAIVREASPSEMVATSGFSRRPHGFVLLCIKELVEACQVVGTDLTAQLLSSGCIDMVVSALTAVEQLGSDINGMQVVWNILRFLTTIDGEALGQIEAKVRAVPSALRYIYESKINHCADFGGTASTFVTILAANLYGRDEDNTFGFKQKDIDGCIALDVELMRCESWGGAFPLAKNQCRGMLNLCISDSAKPMLLGSSEYIPHLLDGLMLDPEHPRKDHDEQIKSAVQRDFAECIQQLSLFGPGAEALKKNPDVVSTLDMLVDKAWSEEAKVCARGALKQLCPRPEPVEIDLHALHIMMSYQWDVQKIVKRIVADLQRRKYLVWFDLECMKGSVMDAMSEAVEGAELMLYGVSEKYKESANCRLELNYGMQEDVDMVPLMMQQGYKAKGWLGLILGQSLWHAFFESAVDTDEKFIQAMDALTREIGDRGKIKAKPAEGVPPPKGATPASAAAAADFEPTPEPAPAPALTPAPAPAPAPEVAAVVPSTSSRASLAVVEPQGFSPSVQQMSPPMPMMSMRGSAESTELVERLLAQQKDLMKEQRDEAKADMEQQRAEAKAEQTERIDAMQRQHAAELARVQKQVQKPPTAAISEEQLSHLQSRLEGLHMTKLLSDDELFTLEDSVADWVEMQASMVDQIVTETTLYATAGHAFGVGVKVHKMLKISAVATGDAAFARQLRRKFL